MIFGMKSFLKNEEKSALQALSRPFKFLNVLKYSSVISMPMW